MTKARFVCPACVDDYAVQAFIADNAEEHQCSYCDAQPDGDGDPIAAPFQDVAVFIRKGIEREYEAPENSVGWDSGEGGWQGVEPMDARDLMDQVGLESSNQEFLEDLCDELNDQEWVHQDPYVLPLDEAMHYSWERFSDQVKHKTRFVFFKVVTTTGEFDSEPYSILDEIGRILCRMLDLVRILPAGTRLIRARQHPAADNPATAKELGSPPKELASQSRMSSAGIPMFYAADSEATAFAETFTDNPAKPHLTFGVFQALRELRLLDLTDIPSVPSIFDEEAAATRNALSFINSFEADVTAPIPDDHSAHYLYVPTQVVAEYFRHVFALPDGGKLDGIVFNTSRGPGGKCYTLFADANQCTDSPADTSKTLVLLSHPKNTIDFTTGTFFR
jgi:HEPN/RES N-terminal domain 1/RES domain